MQKMKKLLDKLQNKENLNFEESKSIFLNIMSTDNIATKNQTHIKT